MIETAICGIIIYGGGGGQYISNSYRCSLYLIDLLFELVDAFLTQIIIF